MLNETSYQAFDSIINSTLHTYLLQNCKKIIRVYSCVDLRVVMPFACHQAMHPNFKEIAKYTFNF